MNLSSRLFLSGYVILFKAIFWKRILHFTQIMQNRNAIALCIKNAKVTT